MYGSKLEQTDLQRTDNSVYRRRTSILESTPLYFRGQKRYLHAKVAQISGLDLQNTKVCGHQPIPILKMG
jgi:hypothetical protein